MSRTALYVSEEGVVEAVRERRQQWCMRITPSDPEAYLDNQVVAEMQVRVTGEMRVQADMPDTEDGVRLVEMARELLDGVNQDMNLTGTVTRVSPCSYELRWEFYNDTYVHDVED
jgi:hypothetical protein